MCAIAGLIGGGDPFLLAQMTEVQAHRGPDDEGVVWFQDSQAGLGHRRLSIIDLSRLGRQPMQGAYKHKWITFNGEIYNYIELRQELEAKGESFRSNTDTEVLLRAYEVWGEECLDRLNGMFAFAIYDSQSREVFLARDHLGIKPLYFWCKNGFMAFASELKALLKIPDVSREINFNALASILMFRYIPDEMSIFQEIHRLQAGCYIKWKISDGIPTQHSYWNPSLEVREGPLHERDLIDELDVLLQNAVKRQMIADVPVGSFLSGGLDSSLLVALMAQNAKDVLHTFTIAFSSSDKKLDAAPSDDVPFARQVAAQFGTVHHDVQLEPRVTELFPKIVWHMDEPVSDPAAFNTYLIAELARNAGIPVLLNGMGGDEVFGGYRAHLSALLAQRVYRRIPGPIRRGLIEPFTRHLPVASASRGFRQVRNMKRFIRSANEPSHECFLGNISYFTREECCRLFLPEIAERIDFNLPFEAHKAYFQRASALDFISQMCYVDTKIFLPCLNLFYSDRATMANSIESRPPLIDRTIVEWSYRLPGKWKIHGVEQKYILKKVAERYLPSNVVYRPKASFGAPMRTWLRRDLVPFMDCFLSREVVEKRQFFQYDMIEKIRLDHVFGREDNSHRLWALLTFELWCQCFLDSER